MMVNLVDRNSPLRLRRWLIDNWSNVYDWLNYERDLDDLINLPHDNKKYIKYLMRMFKNKPDEYKSLLRAVKDVRLREVLNFNDILERSDSTK